MADTYELDEAKNMVVAENGVTESQLNSWKNTNFGTGTYENDGLIQTGSNSSIKIQDNFVFFGVETSIQAVQAAYDLNYLVEINEPNGMMLMLAPSKQGVPASGALDKRKIKNNTSGTISVICIARDEVKSHRLRSGTMSSEWNYDSAEGHYCQLIAWCTVVE